MPLESASGIGIRFRLPLADFTLAPDLVLPDRGITALFGPSGAGKTSVLRAFAGLQKPHDALLRVGEEVWQDDAHGIFLPVHERGVGYVFQEASLFPHLSVRGNLDYAHKRARSSGPGVDRAQIESLLGLAGLLARNPRELSGGERQRVAIARALLANPCVLLFDEPLSALDAASKAGILPYLERLHEALRIPAIYVSHAVDEVARLADHLVLLDRGAVIASGPLHEVATQRELPTFLEDMGTIIETRVLSRDERYGLSEFGFGGLSLWAGGVAHAPGASARARILARDVSISPDRPGQSSILNVLPVRILDMTEEGADKVKLRLRPGHADEGDGILLARITRRSRDQLGLREGQAVYAQVKSVALIA